MNAKSVTDSDNSAETAKKSSFVCQSSEEHLPRTVDLDRKLFAFNNSNPLDGVECITWLYLLLLIVSFCKDQGVENMETKLFHLWSLFISENSAILNLFVLIIPLWNRRILFVYFLQSDVSSLFTGNIFIIFTNQLIEQIIFCVNCWFSQLKISSRPCRSTALFWSVARNTGRYEHHMVEQPFESCLRSFLPFPQNLVWSVDW